jgi:hypothetical protein
MTLVLVHQNYLCRERTLVNGIECNTHFVVRKTPFEIILKSPSGFFGGLNLDCSLLYHQTNKAVDSTDGGLSLGYVCNELPDRAACSVSFRINVLSSQHSNCLFVIRMALGNEVVFSEPIRSVSKPEQIRKKLAQNGDGVDDGADETKPTTKKRARSEELVDLLSTFHHTLQEHGAALNYLTQRPPNTEATYNRPASLEDSMKSLIANFEEEDDQRPTKIGRFISSLDDDKKKVLADLGHFLVNLTEPTHNQSIPPLPFQSIDIDNVNNVGDVFSYDDGSFDGSLNGVNEEVYLPESYLNWLNF